MLLETRMLDENHKEIDWENELKSWKKVNELFGKKKRKPTSTGWICPSCGRVNAPWKSSCDCFVPIKWTWNPIPPQRPYYCDWVTVC